MIKLVYEVKRRAEKYWICTKTYRRGGGNRLACKSLGGRLFEMPRGTEAKRHSLLLLMKFGLFRKIVDILSLVKRNILISPLEGEKKFLSELCELRNFREGYKKYKNWDRATKCAMTNVVDKYTLNNGATFCVRTGAQWGKLEMLDT